MASAHNLIGLVNQLQNIESTMMAAIMEMLMKVATLTDANVFLLVDAVEGRRFAGKRHLVDAYLGGTLGPIGTDVEMELDPSVTALRRRPVNGVSPGSTRPGAPAFRPPFPIRSNGVGAFERHPASKRPMVAPSHSKDAETAAAKRARPVATFSRTPSKHAANGANANDGGGIDDGLDVEVEPAVEASPRIVQTSSSSSPTQKDSAEAASSSALKDHQNLEEDLKTECDLKPSFDIRGFNDDESYAGPSRDDPGSGESDVEELPPVEDESAVVAVEGGGSGVGKDRRDSSFFDSSSSANSSNVVNSADFNADFDILAFMQANPKAVALRAEFDMSVLDKSSVTHKLLTSLLYDISKASAANAPVKDKKSEVSRAYFNYVFENVWESFPNFENLMTMGAKVRDGGKQKNIKYFMRHKMQKWYGAMMDKMLCAEQPPSNTAAIQWC